MCVRCQVNWPHLGVHGATYGGPDAHAHGIGAPATHGPCSCLLVRTVGVAAVPAVAAAAKVAVWSFCS